MKQLRNILTPLVLLCLLAAGFPVFAQEQEEAAPKMQDEMTSKEEKENTPSNVDISMSPISTEPMIPAMPSSRNHHQQRVPQ